MDDIAIVREKILTIDRTIIEFLTQRMDLVRELGDLKKRDGLPVVDASREALLFAELEKSAASCGLSAAYIRALWRVILDESIREQRS